LWYENPSPTVDILLFNENEEVLIAERGVEPAKGKFGFPGGFVEPKETLEQAIVREVSEELGLGSDDYSPPVFLKTHIADYGFSKEKKSLVCTIFVARLKTTKKIEPKDDVASVKFVSLNELDGVDFSLDIYPGLTKEAHKKLFG